MTTASPPYTTHHRREFVKRVLSQSAGDPPSSRALATMVLEEFGERVTHATIQNDIKWLAKQEATVDTYWDDLLQDPEKFPEWRGRLFNVAATRKPYETPKHQMAWFHCLYALVFKVAIPQWVVDYLGLPISVNEDFLDFEKLFTLVILAPPRHGKTELLIHAIIYILLRDPSKRIMFVSGVKQTAQDNMSLIQQEFEFNEELIEAYGMKKADNRQWNTKGFFLADAPPMKTTNVLPLGMGSNVLSKDADLILVDDPQEQEEADSEQTTDKMYKKLRTNVMTRREPHTPVLMVGSHQPTETGDIFNRIENDALDLAGEGLAMHIVKMKAHDYERCVGGHDDPHVTCLLWPTVRKISFLRAQQKMLGDTYYEVCYNQEGKLGRIVYFDPDVVREEYLEPDFDIRLGMIPVIENYEGGILDDTRSWREIPKFHCVEGESLLLALGVDPAASESKRASFTAFVVLGVCRTCKRRFLIDYDQIKQSPEKHPDTIMTYIRAYRPKRVRIEKNAYQKALARDPRLMNERGTWGFQVDEWHTDDRKWDPAFGIPTLSHIIREGRLSVPYQELADQDYAEEFLRSLIRYPNKPNDIPMAFWLAELSIRELLYEAEYATPLVLEGYHGVPDLRELEIDEDADQYYEVDMSEILETNSLDVW